MIKEYRRRLAYAERSPSYYGSSYDADGDVVGIRENIGPWDKAEQACQELLHHNGAVRILRANGFQIVSPREGHDEPPKLLNKKGLFPRTKEIPVFGTD